MKKLAIENLQDIISGRAEGAGFFRDQHWAERRQFFRRGTGEKAHLISERLVFEPKSVRIDVRRSRTLEEKAVGSRIMGIWEELARVSYDKVKVTEKDVEIGGFVLTADREVTTKQVKE